MEYSFASAVGWQQPSSSRLLSYLHQGLNEHTVAAGFLANLCTRDWWMAVCPLKDRIGLMVPTAERPRVDAHIVRNEANSW